MEMAWNFDMSSAPRGQFETETRPGKGGKMVEHTRFVPDRLILAGARGTVTLGKWIPDEERWEMFTKDAPPIAWMPWPKSPAPLS